MLLVIKVWTGPRCPYSFLDNRSHFWFKSWGRGEGGGGERKWIGYISLKMKCAAGLIKVINWICSWTSKLSFVEYPLFEGKRYKWKLLSCVQFFVTPWAVAPSGSSLHGDSPGKDTIVGSHALLQEIFPTQGSNSGLWHCRWILYQLRYQGNPRILEWLARV